MIHQEPHLKISYLTLPGLRYINLVASVTTCCRPAQLNRAESGRLPTGADVLANPQISIISAIISRGIALDVPADLRACRLANLQISIISAIISRGSGPGELRRADGCGGPSRPCPRPSVMQVASPSLALQHTLLLPSPLLPHIVHKRM